MKKFFDETHKYDENDFRRTTWYGYMEANLNEMLIQEIKNIIKKDLEVKQENEVLETHWVLYSNSIQKDAIADKVRFTIYIRFKNNQYTININTCDFDFASKIDEILNFKEELQVALHCKM